MPRRSPDMDLETDVDVVVLGGGLTGLAAASGLGEHAVVLERESQPGGVARSVCYDGYWFDHGAHVLYFRDDALRARVQAMMGDVLVRRPLDGWVQTSAGNARFPFQWNLSTLDPEAAVRCIADLAAAAFGTSPQPPRNLEELLLARFGVGMCELFLLPYNQKLWQRPLTSLSPGGFTWAIASPDLEDVLRGALSCPTARSYNADSWYPVAPADSPARGIGLIARELARQVCGLRVGRTVVSLDLDARRVTVRTATGTEKYGFRQCLSTIPLPTAISLCPQAPPALRNACARLPRNRTAVAAFSVRSRRPDRGQFWYYADPGLPFTRVSYVHAFDPFCAPPEGWCLMAEVPQRAEAPASDSAVLLRDCEAALRRCGALPAGAEVVGARVLTVDPGYVVFSPESDETVAEARAFLRRHGVTPLGRYGAWGYSSMCDALTQGFAWGAAARARAAAPVPEAV